MANVSHASLTGAELHEPKGVTGAALGTVYVADGVGSGSWNNVGTSSFTGMIADFTWPVVQSGWLELDGTDINTTTYAALYAVMSIQQTGTRVSGSAIITSLPSTSNLRAGYYVFGTGIASGTTILSIDSGTQITLSANASSTGSATVVASPWLLNTGTIRLPDLSTAGRYRRSRSATTAVGQLQTDLTKAHTHTGTVSIAGSTDTVAAHNHTANVSDPGHFHSVSGAIFGGTTHGVVGSGSPLSDSPINYSAINIASATTGITVTNIANGAHNHSLTGSGSFTTDSSVGAETRPVSIVVMTCVKT